MHKPDLRGRAVTTLLMLFGSVVLAVSGVVLLIVPRGRTVHALDWSLMSLSKETWEEVHLAFAALFLIVAAVHIWLNHKVLLHYIRERLTRGRERLVLGGITLDLLVAAALSTVLLVLAIYDLPPVSYLSDLQQYAKDVWEAGAAVSGSGSGRWRGAAW